MRVIVAVLMAGLLTGCAAGPRVTEDEVASAPITLSKQQIEVVQRGVRRSMKDPDSARFDEVGRWRAGKSTKGLISVCGYVNAKNSYGGYTGEKPFLGNFNPTGTEFLISGVGGTDIETTVVREFCAKYGLSL